MFNRSFYANEKTDKDKPHKAKETDSNVFPPPYSVSKELDTLVKEITKSNLKFLFRELLICRYLAAILLHPNFILNNFPGKRLKWLLQMKPRRSVITSGTR